MTQPSEGITIKHTGGFFSCCSVRLSEITRFINTNKKLPDYVDSSKQFELYKDNQHKHKDITFDYFKNYNNDTNIDTSCYIDFHCSYQWRPSPDLDYNNLTPLVEKYFSPTNEINEIANNIEQKYSLTYENICVLLYRGNDKNIEIKKCGYDEYLHHANRLLKNNNDLVFLIQSDETGFVEFMSKKFPRNSFYFSDETRHIKKCNNNHLVVGHSVDGKMSKSNFIFSKKYLAITTIMSKCKYIVCSSGNCDMWVMLYRGNCKNVIQHQYDNSWGIY